MRKMAKYVWAVLCALLLVFTACDDSGGSLSAEETETIAAVTVFSGYIPFMMSDLGDGTYDSDSVGISIISGTLVVSGGGSSFVMTDCVVDLSGDGEPADPVTLNGSFSLADIAGTKSFTLSSFTLSSESEGVSGTVNGSHLISDTEWDANITVSISGGSARTITLVMTMAGGEPSGVTSATLDGEDFSAEITAFFDSM